MNWLCPIGSSLSPSGCLCLLKKKKIFLRQSWVITSMIRDAQPGNLWPRLSRAQSRNESSRNLMRWKETLFKARCPTRQKKEAMWKRWNIHNYDKWPVSVQDVSLCLTSLPVTLRCLLAPASCPGGRGWKASRGRQSPPRGMGAYSFSLSLTSAGWWWAASPKPETKTVTVRSGITQSLLQEHLCTNGLNAGLVCARCDCCN